MDFIAIDFETANQYSNSACSVGLAFVDNLEVVRSEYYLIRPPELLFNGKNVSIHGITADDVKDAPEFPVIWAKISHYFADVPIIAHNSPFDMSVLRRMLDEYHLDVPDFTYYDSMWLAAVKGVSKSLESLAAYYDVPLDNHHNSECDAICCANIVIAAIKKKYSSLFDAYCKDGYFYSKPFSDLNVQYSFAATSRAIANKKFKADTIVYKELAASKEITDTSHPFYNKAFVFTGELQSLSRREAIQKVLDVGGIVKGGVSSRINYLVVGIQDNAIVGDDGMSSKEEKAHQLIESGKDIKILREDEFLNYFNE